MFPAVPAGERALSCTSFKAGVLANSLLYSKFATATAWLQFRVAYAIGDILWGYLTNRF
jgi:hypothetical protein